jgi:uncharacterized membrane protein
MSEDGYASSLPVAIMSGDNLTPEQIFNMFTTITYDKGVSLLFMLEDIVGAESIRNALRVSSSISTLIIVIIFLSFCLYLSKYKEHDIGE